jgi:iron complex outermembrane receptor protein
VRFSTGLQLAGASLLVLAGASAASAQTSSPSSDPAAVTDVSPVIVTGTRVTGLRAADSSAPIQILNAEGLSRVGQPNLIQALAQIVPSFTAESVGNDTGNLIRSARLRGLSANHALVLVNGKRRHGTANLHIVTGPYQGAAAADLDLIPPSAIDHIEILQDGAAAQYGSDAIAGVINIILKTDRTGGTVSVTGGSYGNGEGETAALTGRIALPLGEDGYFDLAVSHQFHDYSQQGGGDRRLVQPDGTPLTGVPTSWQSIPGYPNVNPVVGDPRSHLTTVFFNTGYDFGGVEAYSFGSYGRRVASARESFRLPTQVTRTVDAVKTQLFPNGFVPRLGLKEDDFALTAGLRGTVSHWDWDLSGTYGRDRNDLSTLDSANASLYADTGSTPRDFYDGAFIASQFTANLDVKRGLELGLAEPVTIALGGEFRRDTYEIRAGDAASLYKEGGQSFPGFQPTDAGSHNREAWSAYVDVAANPVEAWTVDVAGRLEHYSDFGSKAVGKLTSRYDFSDQIAVRGTVSTGFRAPTLAESYYSATQVSPVSAIVQLPANSAAAAVLGFAPLKPERSTNLSGGLIVHPIPRLTISLDAYQIAIKNRIGATGIMLGSVLTQAGRVVLNQSVLDAIAAHGTTPDATAQYVAASTLANGIDTRTRGIELALSYPSQFGFGRVDWSLAGNYNKTEITANRLGAARFNSMAESYIETASPRFKATLGALVTRGDWSLNWRETAYGKTSSLSTPTGSAPYYTQTVKAALITDLEVAWRPVNSVKVAIGANNLFDRRPETTQPVPGSTTSATSGPTLISGNQIYDAPILISPYGINGGYYYARLSFDF